MGGHKGYQELNQTDWAGWYLELTAERSASDGEEELRSARRPARRLLPAA